MTPAEQFAEWFAAHLQAADAAQSDFLADPAGTTEEEDPA
jgi:hypothetical protein